MKMNDADANVDALIKKVSEHGYKTTWTRIQSVGWTDTLSPYLISSCHEESLLNDRKRAERQQASHKKLKQSTGKS